MVPEDLSRHYAGLIAYVAALPKYNHRISMSLQKLSRFSTVHLSELSCDIFDEIDRRRDAPNSGHLPPRKDIHQKRNNARYQFGDLSVQRFGDMCRDVIAELERRFPELHSDVPEIPPLHRTRTLRKGVEPVPTKQTEVVPTKSTMVMEESDSDPEYESWTRQASDSIAVDSPIVPESAYSLTFRDSPDPRESKQSKQSSKSAQSAGSSLSHDWSFDRNSLGGDTSTMSALEKRLAASSNLGLSANNDFHFGVEEQLIDSRSSRMPPGAAITSTFDPNSPHALNVPPSPSDSVPGSSSVNSSAAHVYEPIATGLRSPPPAESTVTLRPTEGLGIHSPETELGSSTIAQSQSPRLMVANTTPRVSSSLASSPRSYVSGEETPHDSLRSSPGLVEYSSHLEDQVRELEQLNAEVVKENEQLHNMLADTENERKQLEVRVGGTPGPEVDELKQELRTLQAEYARVVAAQSEPRELDGEASRSLGEQHQALTDSHTNLEAELARLQAEHEALRQTHAALLQSHDSLQDEHAAEISVQRSLHANLASEHDTLRETHMALVDQHSALQERSADLPSVGHSQAQLTALQTQHSSLQAQHGLIQEDHRNLKEEYTTLQGAYHHLQTQYANLQNEQVEPKGLNIQMEDYNALATQHKTLLAELEGQRSVTEQVRQEAKRMLGEMRSMTKSSLPFAELQRQLAQAKAEAQHWRSVSNSKLDTRTRDRESIIESPSLIYDPQGLVDNRDVLAFQDNIEELLKTRSLESLHVVIASVEKILGCIPAESTTYAKQTRMVMRTANQLISATRNSTEQGPLFHRSIVTAACSDLSYAMCEFLRDAKVKPGEFLTPSAKESLDSIDGRLAGARAAREDSALGGDKRRSSSGSRNSIGARRSVTSPVTPSSPPRVRASSNRVSSARTSPLRTETATSPPPQAYASPARASPARSSPMRSSPGHTALRSAPQLAAPMAPMTTRAPAVSALPKTADQEPGSRAAVTTVASASPVLVSTPRAAPAAPVAVATTPKTVPMMASPSVASPVAAELSPKAASVASAASPAPSRLSIPPVSIPVDSTVAELQAYLEEQTSETVDSIRELLSGIKADLQVEQLRPLVDSIVYYVDLMVRTTGACMDRTEHWLLKDKGSFILQNLDDCCRRMAALRGNLDEFEDEDAAPRPLKQRLAGVSFDMAKCTKELVKTVEDVSLKSEIETIDQTLRARK